MGDGWDAALTGFREHFQLDLRECVRSMPLADVLGFWRRMTELHWSMHEENTGRILDILEWRAETDWAQWTTPPEELARQRAIARRQGTRAPEHPPIPPVALRPEPIADQRFAQVQRLYESAVLVERYLTADELDAYIA